MTPAASVAQPTAASLRTAIQALVAAGGTAAINYFVHLGGRYLPGALAGAIFVVLAALVAWAQNTIENSGVVGTFLREATLTDAGAARKAAKEQAKALKAAEASKIANNAPASVAPPTVDLQKMVDAAVAKAVATTQQSAQPSLTPTTEPVPPATTA